MPDLPDLDSTQIQAALTGSEKMSGKAQLDILYGKITKDVKKCSNEKCKITSEPTRLDFA